MSKKTRIKNINVGDRVRCLEMPFKSHTGTVVEKTRLLHLTKVVVVRLDVPAGLGGGLARCRRLQVLTPDEDPGIP